MIASSWMDPVLGVDLHWEMVPTPAPTPMPFPHPFIGVVLDVGGLIGSAVMGGVMSAVTGAPFQGPVIHWFMPATNTGTESRHVPGHFIIPPGTIWAPVPRTPKPKIRPGEAVVPAPPIKPENDAVAIFGSKTVTIGGSNAVRLGDIQLSCSEPVRLPSSVTLAIPKGAPILIGGPPSLDLMAAALASLRTRFVSDSLHALVSRLAPGRFRNLLNRTVCFFTGHPVDVASGKVITSAVDAELPGPLPLEIERVYSSAFGDRDGPLGHGWSWSLDQAVWTERGKVVLLAEDGREIEFDAFDLPDHAARAGDELHQPIDQLTLRCLKDGGWQLIDADGATRDFAPVPGRTDGRAMIQRIRSASGLHEILFEYGRSGRLERVRDSCGRPIGIEYGPSGRVEALRLPLPHEEGSYVHRRYLYDAQGDLVQVVDALDHAWRFEYVTHLLVRETDRNALSFYFEYDGLGQDAWCTRTWGDGGILDRRIAYDKAGKITYVTDSLGHTTRYHMNMAGLVVKVIDPLQAETRYAHDPRTLQQIEEVDPLGNATTWSYDDRLRCTRISTPDGAQLELEYDARGRLARATDAEGGRWEWEYDALGQLVREASPTGSINRYAYTGGLLTEAVLPGGRIVRLEYDGQKTLARIRTPAGGESRQLVDRLGQLVAVHDGRGGVEQYRRDLEGREIEAISASGARHELQYDPEGNLLQTRGPGEAVRYRYGHLHRVVERAQGGAAVRYRYDAEGRLTGVVNEAGEEASFELDAAGRVIREIGFDGAVRRYERDKAGRIVKVQLPSGRTTRLEYDAAGRPTKVEHSDGTGARFEYGPGGFLLSAENESARVTLQHDPLGRRAKDVQRARDGEYAVLSRYGLDGFRDALETSLGAGAVIESDPFARITAVHLGRSRDSARGPAVRFERDVSGLETARLHANGVRVGWSWDRSGNPIERRITAAARAPAANEPWAEGQEVEARRFTWSDDDRITAIAVGAEEPIRYRHDERGRLTDAILPDGERVPRAADPAGNLPDRSDRTYAAGGRLAQVNGSRCTYDPDGNLIEKRLPDGRAWKYAWNGSGLLREVERPDGNLVRFEYDAFARRIRKTLLAPGEDGGARPLRSTRYVWDDNVVVHELADGSEPITWYWDPDSFAPLAKEQGGRRWFIVNDHVDAPTHLFDEAGQLVATISADPFGGRSPQGQPVPFGYPGQYGDEETGLYYNRWRYYDPADDRYLSADPLGPLVSLDLYGYPGDPLIYVDPLGLIVLRHVPYNDHPLFSAVRDHYASNGGPKGIGGRNVAVFQLADGQMIPMTSGKGPHSEELLLAQLEKNGIHPSQVTAVYTELEPCRGVGMKGCMNKLQNALGGDVPVYWSFKYPPTSKKPNVRLQNRIARRNAVRQKKRAAKKHCS
ncbi:MAG TPA: DUF6531 domain-containing protein [Anaeromyxobacter sp.]|nr:DUF6531 domain-containing protein [Anaeromyxobacter sp.]